MNKYLIESYDAQGRPYLSLSLPQFSRFVQDNPSSLKKEENSRGVIVINMHEADENDNNIVFEI